MGVLAATALILAFRGDGYLAIALFATSLALLLGTAVFGANTVGWHRRAGRAVTGAASAAVAGLATVLVLRGHVDWFDAPDDTIIYLFMLIAAIPGATAAAAGRARFALVLGFDLAIVVTSLAQGRPTMGVAMLLAVGTVTGALLARRP